VIKYVNRHSREEPALDLIGGGNPGVDARLKPSGMTHLIPAQETISNVVKIATSRAYNGYSL
jgi:hypothetical protein